MDAVIKIIAGPEKGQEFKCVSVETIAGRSPRCLIRLSSPSVSYEHAIITRTGNDYLLENLSANGTFLNNERISTKTRLRAKDQFRIGDETVARVESVPSSSTPGSSRTLLLGLFVVLLVILLAVVYLDPFSTGPTQRQNSRAYIRLLKFTQDEVAAGKLPREAEQVMQEAWRLEVANNRPAAQKQWLSLRALLSNSEPTTGYLTSAGNYPRALSMLSDPKSTAVLSEEEMGAALVEFAGQMERRK